MIRLRAGQLPYVSLTADIFYRVLASEIAAQRGMYGTAATTMVGLARDTGDPAWRAARWNSSWRAATCPAPWTRPGWARLSPNDLEASSTELALAAANGQTRGLSQALRNRIDASRDKPAAIGQALAVLSRLNDRRLALRILDESFSDGVRKLPAAHMALADVANAAGDDERAAQEARAALAADPKSEPAAQRVLEYGFRSTRSAPDRGARLYRAQSERAQGAPDAGRPVGRQRRLQRRAG